MDYESIEEVSSGGIYLPKETTDKERSGVQIAEVLDVGEYAFDDQPGVTVKPGQKVVTGRYPGSQLDLDQNWSDAEAARYRVILDNEVRLLVSDDGVEL